MYVCVRVRVCVCVCMGHCPSPHVLEGDYCEVRDPRHGNLYNLIPLGLNDTVVRAGEYTYYFRVCGELSSGVCPTSDKSKVISSCQEKRGPEGFQKVAGIVVFFLLFLQKNGIPYLR